MLKAIVIAALGGMLSGHVVRNGIGALFLMIALISGVTALESAHQHWSPLHYVGFFAVLDTIGSGAVLVSEALSA